MKPELLLGTVLAILIIDPEVGVAQGKRGDFPTPSEFGKVASYKTVCFNKLERQYLHSLDSDREVIVEGTMREIARIKLAQPSCASPAIEAKISTLAILGSTPAIRFKASLIAMVFQHPEYFADESDVDFHTPDEMFAAISRRIEKELLAATEQNSTAAP